MIDWHYGAQLRVDEGRLSQNGELLRVKARIKALTERTIERGCTEAEAMAAAEMVGRLLERYALTMDEVDVRQEPCVQVEMPIGGKQRRPIDATVPAIARFCDCKVWLTRSNHGMISYIFFGFETDTALAAYLFTVIDRAIRTELGGFRKRSTSLTGIALRRSSASFQHGMAARVSERLEAMHAEREAVVSVGRPAGTALIVLRHQVVEDAFQATKLRLRAMPGLTQRRNAAFHAGLAAGDRVNLERPITGADRGRLSG
jgi:hypothetical protein